MSAKRNDAFSEVIVGFFMLAVLSLLVYFTIIISGVDLLHGRRKVIAQVAFTDVGGLKDHDNVMYRGTKVGTVDHITLSPTNLTVTIEIDESVVLRDSYRIAVCNLSMLGGNYLLLEEGLGNVLPLETTLFAGEQPTDWMRDVSNIAKNLNEFTSGGELQAIVTNLTAASEKINSIVARVERGEGMVGKLLSADETLYNDVCETMTDAKSVMADAKEISGRLSRGEGTLGKLLSSDEKLYNDLAKTLENVGAASETLKTELGEALASFRKACDSMDLKDTVASANQLLASLNEVAERLKKGEGTVGKLLAKDDLYNEVEGLTKDVRQVLDNFRDTTPISTFGSLIMGGL